MVIGPTVEMPVATGIAERVRASHPATTVVLIRHDLAPQVFAEAMSVGIGAVVAADDSVGVTAAVSRARTTWETINGPPRKPPNATDA